MPALRISDRPTSQRLSLPLEPIVQKFPEYLKQALSSLPSPNQTIDLALEELPEQLKRGSVRVTFGEIRKALPSAFVEVNQDFDRLFINLPIGLIVPHVKLDRRSNRREMTVPEEGVADFDLQRQPKAAAPVPPPLSVATPSPPEPVVHPLDPPALRLAADDASPLSAPLPEAPLSDASSAADGSLVRVTVSEIEDFLSGDAMAEVSAHELEGRGIHIPSSVLGAMHERGRILLDWGQLLQWMRPAGPSSAVPHFAIEIPLPLIAPRLHEVLGTVASAEEPPPELDASILEIDIDDLAVGPDPEEASFEFDLSRADFSNEQEQWQPAAVAARLREIEGVEGVVVASRDGLVVASDVSSEIDATVMAAFMPDISVRTTVYVTEMNLPSPDFMEITLGSQRLLLATAGDLFLGILTGGPSPTVAEQIKEVADRLHQFGSVL